MGRVLVIGGNGFIGSHLVDTIIRDQQDVTVLDQSARRFSKLPQCVHFIQADFNDSIAKTEKIIAEMAPDVIFHLAWKTLPETSIKNPIGDIGINIIPTLNLINFCAKAGIKLIFTSSGGAVYGTTNKSLISERDETSPISPYGIEKLMVEKYLFMYRHLYGLDYLTIRPSTPFGPWQDYQGKQGAVSIFMYRIAKGLPVILWGDGKIVRDYFYISDLVDAMIACIKHNAPDDKRIFNVGGGKGVSLLQLIGWIEEIVGKKAIVDQRPERKFDPQTVVLDTTLVRNELGWSPKVSLQQGLQQTWKWMSKIS
jgi:UDP-glucose 4-epimerase